MKGKILAILIALSCTITSNVMAKITIEGEAAANEYYIYPENGAYVNSFDGFTIFKPVKEGRIDYIRSKNIVITNGKEEISMSFEPGLATIYQQIWNPDMYKHALRIVPEKDLTPGDWTLVIPAETIYFSFYQGGDNPDKYSWLKETHITIHVGKKLCAKCIYDVETESTQTRSIVLPAKIRLKIKGLQLTDENGESSFEEVKTIDLNPNITPCEVLEWDAELNGRFDEPHFDFSFKNSDFVLDEDQFLLEEVAFWPIDPTYHYLTFIFLKGILNINGYDVESFHFGFGLKTLDDISNIKFEKPEFLINGNSISISEYNGMPWAIYDLTGRCVYRGTSENVELSSGIYIVSSDYFAPQKICIP